MARVKAAAVPTIARAGKVSKYASQMDDIRALLGEKDFGAGEAEAFEVAKEELDPLVSALRKAAKGLGRKIKTVYKDGTLYAQDGGEFGSESASAATIRAGKAAK